MAMRLWETQGGWALAGLLRSSATGEIFQTAVLSNRHAVLRDSVPSRPQAGARS